MRLHPFTVPALALLLAACSAETGNEGENIAAAGANELTPALPEGGADPSSGTSPDGSDSPAGQPGPQAPADNGQAPRASGPVTLSAAPARTGAGATMALTLSNGSREQVGYNLCTSAIQTSAGRPVLADRVCTMELRTLDPGRSADYSYELPRNLAEGKYRFLTQVERMASRRREAIRSNGFEVR